jgi:putative glycosyltransferase (TIGR04348 family)
MGITQNIKRGHVVIISPALSEANNGNWQTANRWRQMLAKNFHCRIVKTWPDKFANQDDVMIALHARKSASSIAAWHEKHGGSKLVLALTGTDLYRDIQTDAAAQASLAMACRIIVLQELALLGLPEQCQSKAEVIFQSTTSQPTLEKPAAHLRAVMVGHLRDEKSPETLFAAARLLGNPDFDKLSSNGVGNIFIDHIGAGLDAALAKEAEATAKACPHYRWLDAVPHEATRRAIGRAHVLVHASKMEGGAHVLMEAVCSGTPVLASRIDGNVGMLGADYAGYFDWGDAAGLARLLCECRASQSDVNKSKDEGLLARLSEQCAVRAPLFAPLRESQKLNALVDSLFLQKS